jgi:hypothetical protein
MVGNNLRLELTSKSELPIAVYSDEYTVAVHGWFPVDANAGIHDAMPGLLQDRINRADEMGEPVEIGGFSWQPALFQGFPLYGAGLLTRYEGMNVIRDIVVRIPQDCNPRVYIHRLIHPRRLCIHHLIHPRRSSWSAQLACLLKISKTHRLHSLHS